MKTILGAACLAVTLSAEARAQTSACERYISASEFGRVVRFEDAKDYREPLRCIMGHIDKFEADLNFRKGSSKSDRDLRTYLTQAEAVVEIIERVGRPAIEAVREMDSTDTASVLAAGARHPDFEIRIASSYILSNIIDNSTTCVVLDYLHADVEESPYDNADIYGRANLVQMLNAVALWSYKENFNAIQQTKDEIKSDILGLPGAYQENLENTKKGLIELERRIDRVAAGGGLRAPSSNTMYATKPLPDADQKACASYDFKFWKDGNPYVLK